MAQKATIEVMDDADEHSTAARFAERAHAEHVAADGTETYVYSSGRVDITLRPDVYAAHVIDMLELFGGKIDHSWYDSEQRKIITVSFQ